MLTTHQIKVLVSDIIVKYPVKKLSIFGSYADGTAHENSDIDILIEFLHTNVSLIMLYDIKEELEIKLSRKVDLIHAPLDENTLIAVNKVVDIYEL
ncbi:nucleotidyltransferase family protein [Desulfitibacter alkalitolerans]|uniref:nucleotidyltransferase family protein n=1 Tax=Desulfitibacter alkalitolerans TaxID=264641 RepID=UPI00048105CE|nr:nucleotidyltransferase domain-containing protein [Desulfitibacter alkalitolerans]